MHFNMERWYNAVGQRFSVRRYSGEPDNEQLASLQETAKLLSARGVRIELGITEKAFEMKLGGPKITGTACFAAFIAKKDARRESVGYLGEAFILECTALDLGTCWAGASYNKAAVSACLQLEADEKLALITAIGARNENYSPRPRKGLDKLTGLTQAQLIDLPEWQQRALECARMAPSAIDAQPWEFIVKENAIAVKRTHGNFGYGSLDCGIAMLHMELGAAHCGVTGEWEIGGNTNTFVAAQD